MGSRRVETYIAYAVAALVVSLVLAQIFILDGIGPGDYVIYALMGAMGWWSWPSRKGQHVDHATAQAQAKPDDIIVYWRPG